MSIAVSDWVLHPGQLLLGVACLIFGGSKLVDGAETMAARLGVSPILIGLTVVAFGTSAPELALNITAAIKGNTELAFGNVIGSNIANVGLILGLCAMLRPLQIHAGVVKRELPIMLVATVVCMALALLAPGAPDSGIRWPAAETALGPAWDPGLTWIDGVALLAIFGAFNWMTIVPERKRLRTRADDVEFAEGVEGKGRVAAGRPLGRALLLFGFGLALLIVGGNLSESGASGIARALGLTDALIGLTIVAIATSLPELATSVVAVRRGQVDIAVGNIVGSNIFNIALVLGATSVVSPVEVPRGGLLPLLVMGLLSFSLLPVSMTRGRTLSRLEGSTLLLIYLVFLAVQGWQAVEILSASPGAS